MDWKVVAVRAFDRFIQNEEGRGYMVPLREAMSSARVMVGDGGASVLAERYELAMALACVDGISQGRGVYPSRARWL